MSDDLQPLDVRDAPATMRSFLRLPAALLFAAALLGATGAKGSATVWQSAYQPIKEMSGDATLHPLLRPGGTTTQGNTGEARGIPVPFEFLFLGQGPYTELNAGAKGYVIPGTIPVGSSVNRGDPSYLLVSLAPHNLVAAWWGDHSCTFAQIPTKVLGTAPHRQFVLEWDGCGISGSGRSVFEAQIWLYEGSDVVRVKYGGLSQEGTATWPRIGWGTKGTSGIGTMGPERDGSPSSCDPSLQRGSPGACDSTFFPAYSTIQYGLFDQKDLAGRLTILEAALQGAPRIRAELDLVNAGSLSMEEIGLELFLAAAENPVPAAPANVLLYTHPPTESLEAHETKRLELQASPARIPPGSYRFCAALDPNKLVDDVDRSNNWICDQEVYHLGPDLTGSIVAPATGSPGAAISFPIELRNDGNQDAGPFQFRIRVLGLDGTPRVIHQGTSDGLLAYEAVVLEIDAVLPLLLRGTPLYLELELDPEQAVDDIDRSNNIIRSAGEMQNLVAELSFVGTPSFEFLNGCFFGEPIQASLELCNEGEADALGFYPGLAISSSPGSGIGFDPVAASSLPYCGTPGTWSYQGCAPIQGVETICAEGYCRLECEDDSDCGEGLRCLDDPALATLHEDESAKSCRNHLRHGVVPRGERCRTYHLEGKIPFEDVRGRPLQGGAYYLKIADDLEDVLNQSNPAIAELGPFDCAEALPELEALDLRPLDPLVAGKVFRIQRRIANTGFTSFVDGAFDRQEKEPFRYRYYLSKTENVSKNQLPLSVVGGSGGEGEDSLGRGEESQRIDRVEIPSELAPGTYYLGLVIDPDVTIREKNKRNNLQVIPAPLFVEAPALRIVSAQLPRAVVGRRFQQSLVASAAGPAAVWSADSLPPGLSLQANGSLEGMPLEEGIFSFRVRVQLGTLRAERLLALEVLPPASSLEVTTTRLPPALRGAPYGQWFDPEQGAAADVVRLAAAGGYPPYRWELDPEVPANRLPLGLVGPTEDGFLGGTATPLSKTTSIVVRVTDARGSRVSQPLELLVLEEGALIVPAKPLPLAVSGEAYAACVDARGGSDELRWSLPHGALPSGLEAEPSGRQLCLRGSPKVCGVFTVEVHVQDDSGQSTATPFELEIECGALQLNARDLVPLSPGMELDLLLRAIPSRAPSFHLVGGELPEGLALEEDGRLHGQVAEDAWIGTYDSIVELRDEEGRRGLSALSLTVQGAPRELIVRSEKRSGCSSTSGGPFAGVLLAAAAIVPLGRRSSRERSSRRTAAPRHGRFLRAIDLHRRVAADSRYGRRSPLGAQQQRRLVPAAPSNAAMSLFWGLLVLATAACGAETVTTELSRCVNVECGENQLCDEVDGFCKCGGSTCQPEESCALEPSPHCTTATCAFVSCDRGMSCHPVTGDCVCGNVSCEEEERCVQGVCTSADPCEGVSCDDGLSCDPRDGSCSCAGELCEVGAACVDGACVSDPCLGVSCGRDSVCNQEDGNCHCGEAEGPICSAGEVCADEGAGFGCMISTFCDGVSCPAGESCDPDDGVCRCGGLGSEHPGCNQGESCLEGVCRGGDLCAPGGVEKICAPGLSCDPLDGLCKCGGKDGSICAQGEGCTTMLGTATCLKSCSPLVIPSECAAGEGCYLAPDRDYRSAFCSARGVRRLGQPCEGPSACTERLFCSRGEVCTQLCQVGESPDRCPDVAPDLECIAVREGGDVGYCRAP